MTPRSNKLLALETILQLECPVKPASRNGSRNLVLMERSLPLSRWSASWKPADRRGRGLAKRGLGARHEGDRMVKSAGN